jgi:cytochrome c553
MAWLLGKNCWLLIRLLDQLLLLLLLGCCSSNAGHSRNALMFASNIAQPNERAPPHAYLELGLVQGSNSLVCAACHGHKGKATRPATLTVLRDEGILIEATKRAG